MPTRLLRDWTDSFAVNDLDADAERLFVRLIMKADDFGRFHADPRLIKASCFPLKGEIRDTDITRWLAACQKAGMVRCYSDSRGRKFLEIANFKQRTRATESKYPPPPPLPPIDGQMTDKCPSPDGPVTRSCQTSAHVFGDGDGDEVVFGAEGGDGGERENEREREDLQRVVEEILAAYPRRDSPVECRRAVVDGIHTGEEGQQILQAVRECATLIHSAPGGSANRFVPAARTFFGEKQWRSPEAFQNRWKPGPDKTPGAGAGHAARDERGQRRGEIPSDVRADKIKRY